MGVSVEWILETPERKIGVVRSGPEHERYLDPYTKSMTVDGYSTEAVLKGLCAPPTTGERRRLDELLRERGFETRVREVVRDGRMVRRIVTRLHET